MLKSGERKELNQAWVWEVCVSVPGGGGEMEEGGSETLVDGGSSLGIALFLPCWGLATALCGSVTSSWGGR